MALRYERAAGAESANPIGVRADARPNTQGMIALPNLQPPGLSVAARSDVIPPVGFGPIAPTWPGRREKLGRLAATGLTARWNLAPLPSDIDPAYFNSAPRDQQVEEIRINERIVLENLHPDHPRLVTILPGVRPRAFVEVAGRPPQEIGMRCETLWIDTSRSICTLTWRGHVENPPADGRVRVALERPGQQLTWTEVEQQTQAPPERPKSERKPDDVAPAVTQRPQTISMSVTLEDLRNSSRSTGLPFAPTPGAPGAQSPSVAPPAVVQFAAPAPVPPPSVSSMGIPESRWTKPPESIPAPPMSSRWSGSEARADAPPVMTVGQATAQPGIASSPTSPSTPIVAAALRSAPQSWAGKALQLVWFDPESLPRVHRKPELQALLRALEDRAPDTELDNPSLAKDPSAAEDRRDIFEVLESGVIPGSPSADGFVGDPSTG